MVLQLASPFFIFYILSPWFLVSKILWLVHFHVVATVLNNKICFLRNWITWWTRRARFQQSSSHMHTCIGWLCYHDLSSYSHHLPLTFPLCYPQRSGLSFFPLIILISYVFDNELLASLIDVMLPSHLSGEFVVTFLLSLHCLSTSF